MVNLLFAEDGDALTKPGTVCTLFDPACGSGGMLPEPRTTCASSTPRPGSRSSARSSMRTDRT